MTLATINRSIQYINSMVNILTADKTISNNKFVHPEIVLSIKEHSRDLMISSIREQLKETITYINTAVIGPSIVRGCGFREWICITETAKNNFDYK